MNTGNTRQHQTSIEQNKTIVRRLMDEIVNQGNLDAIDELISDDLVRYRPPGTRVLRGNCESFKQDLIGLRAILPDLRIEIDDMLAEGDKVAVRWTFRGTHQGDLFGIPATGKSFAMTGVNIYRVAGGKLVEDWESNDLLGLMQQLGVSS